MQVKLSTYLWITGRNLSLKWRWNAVTNDTDDLSPHIVKHKRIKSAVIKFQIEKISSQDRKQCFQTYSAEIVPPGIPERLKDFLKPNHEVYGYRKLASAWSRTQMTPTQNGTLQQPWTHIFWTTIIIRKQKRQTLKETVS